MDNKNHNTVRLVSHKPSGGKNQHSRAETEIEPVYQEFSWVESSADFDRCEHDMRDMTDGLTVIAGMLEVDRLNPELGKRPLFAPIDAGRLMRMMVAANRMMTELRDLEIDNKNEKARVAGGAR